MYIYHLTIVKLQIYSLNSFPSYTFNIETSKPQFHILHNRDKVLGREEDKTLCSNGSGRDKNVKDEV